MFIFLFLSCLYITCWNVLVVLRLCLLLCSIFLSYFYFSFFFFFFQAEDGIRDGRVTGVQTCALPICALGLILAVWGIDLVIRAVPVEMPYYIQFDFDWRVFSFSLALGLGSAVLFGL